MSPILSGKEKPAAIRKVLYRGPADLVTELDAAAKALGLTRTEAMTQLLRYALDEHRKEAGRKPKK